MRKRCIILANGQAPKISEFKYLFKKGFDKLICADGGADSALKLGLKPDFIIGDLDSVAEDTLKFFDDVKTINLSGQNDTDVEKCLKFGIKNNFSEAVLLGATGDRLDHTFCNLGIVLKFFEKIKLYILHQKTLLSAYEGNVNLKTIPGETISIYGFDEETLITTRGLRYPLNRESLPFGKRESTSNVAKGSKISIEIENGRVFIIREFSMLKKNDFFLAD